MKFEKPSDINSFPKIYADRVRVHEIIDNLLSNAVKYTEKGGIEIKLSKEGKYARVDIIDTGIGIHEKDLNNLGKKFYRSKQYITEGKDTTPLVRPGGTGLGLFVTYGLIQAHDGSINVKSQLGKGTTFTFTLPLANGNEKEESRAIQPNNVFERLGLEKKGQIES